jgi:hypothetical protein
MISISMSKGRFGNVAKDRPTRVYQHFLEVVHFCILYEIDCTNNFTSSHQWFSGKSIVGKHHLKALNSRPAINKHPAIDGPRVVSIIWKVLSSSLATNKYQRFAADAKQNESSLFVVFRDCGLLKLLLTACSVALFFGYNTVTHTSP